MLQPRSARDSACCSPPVNSGYAPEPSKRLQLPRTYGKTVLRLEFPKYGLEVLNLNLSNRQNIILPKENEWKHVHAEIFYSFKFLLYVMAQTIVCIR